MKVGAAHAASLAAVAAVQVGADDEKLAAITFRIVQNICMAACIAMSISCSRYGKLAVVQRAMHVL